MNEIKIKDLNEIAQKETVVFQKENLITNLVTGEVSEIGTTSVKKTKRRDSFIKLFVENLDFVVRLENQEKTLFFYFLIKVDYNNLVSFDTNLKHSIVSSNIMAKATMYRAFQGLLNKKVLLKLEESQTEEMVGMRMKDCYILNPNLVGRGSWNELKKLRHTITREADFENFEIKQTIQLEAEYEGLQEILSNPNQYTIGSIEHNISKDGKRKDLRIVIDEKDNQEQEINPSPRPQIKEIEKVEETKENNETINQENLELIKEQGKLKALELEIKNKEIELIRLKLKERLIMEGKIEEALKI